MLRTCRKLAGIGMAVGMAGLAVGCGRKAPDSQAPTSQPTTRIAFAYFGPDVAADYAMTGFLEGLAQAGYVEGRNLEVTRKHAAGEIANLPMIMQTLDNQGYDLIVPMTTPGVGAACQAVRQTKMVFFYTYDPLGAGAGRSLADHLPLATGVASFPPIADTMEVIRRAVPDLKVLGTVYNASEANSVKAVRLAGDVLKSAGIQLEEVTVTSTSEVMQATLALLGRQPQAVWATGDNTVLQAIEGVIKPTADARVPLFLNDPEFVERGALAGVGIEWRDSGLAAARLAVRVLRGEDPAGIPIEEVARKRVVVNQAVAAALGVSLPPDLQPEAEAPKAGTPE